MSSTVATWGAEPPALNQWIPSGTGMGSSDRSRDTQLLLGFESLSLASPSLVGQPPGRLQSPLELGGGWLQAPQAHQALTPFKHAMAALRGYEPAPLATGTSMGTIFANRARLQGLWNSLELPKGLSQGGA
jgi:hypothetical protein